MVMRLRRLRHRLASGTNVENAALRQQLQACWQADRGLGKQSWHEAQLLVVDAEMSALDLRRGELLSIGWVVINKGGIALRSAQHLLLKPQNTVGESATVHNLRDCELQQGLSEAAVLQEFLSVAAGKALVFHHSRLDLAFLNRISKQLCGSPLLLPVIDTLLLEKKRLERNHQVLGRNALRLASCRVRYNLPDYPAHNALMDALATAELLLAQVEHKGGHIRLRDLLV